MRVNWLLAGMAAGALLAACGGAASGPSGAASGPLPTPPELDEDGCPQRAFPFIGRTLAVDENQSRQTPYGTGA